MKKTNLKIFEFKDSSFNYGLFVVAKSQEEALKIWDSRWSRGDLSEIVEHEIKINLALDAGGNG